MGEGRRTSHLIFINVQPGGGSIPLPKVGILVVFLPRKTKQNILKNAPKMSQNVLFNGQSPFIPLAIARVVTFINP